MMLKVNGLFSFSICRLLLLFVRQSWWTWPRKYDQLQAMGVEVYSVSCDSHFVHKAWHDASDSIRKIKYPMLADPTGALARAFGVYIESEGMAYRGTFLINPEGQIKVAEMHDNIGRDANELLVK